MQKEGLKKKKVHVWLNESCGSGCKFGFAGTGLCTELLSLVCFSFSFPKPKGSVKMGKCKKTIQPLVEEN